MKFLVEGIRCGDCERDIIDALLHIDLVARVKVDALIHRVGVAGPHDAATGAQCD